MAVAKTYEHAEIISEPYFKDGRKYVDIREKCPRCGGSGIWSWGPYGGTCYKCGGSGILRNTVRWYTDAERASQDRQAVKRVENRIQRQKEREEYRSGAEFNGFTNGFVIAILGNTYEIKDELKEAGAKYTHGLGWHFDNLAKVPAEYLPRCRTISWEEASVDGHIKSASELEQLVTAPQSDSCSSHMYTIGERVRGLLLQVTKTWEGPGYTMHTMTDDNGNVFMWTTSSRNLPLDAQVTMDATIKAHTEYKGVKQTVITRPSIKDIVV